MRIDIATLFPEMCDAVLGESIIGRARRAGRVQIYCHQIREYSRDKHRRVDDYPYGGGCGMLMQAEPIALCCEDIICRQRAEGIKKPHIVFLTAAGKPYDQKACRRLSRQQGLVLVCGHYEGMDQRVIDALADEELSIGDYVVTGGELAALVVADSVSRLLPGVLAEPAGYEGESHYSGLLEYPQYTRPEIWRGVSAPPVLLGGDHAKVAAWQREQALERTRLRRPDLYETFRQEMPEKVKSRKNKI